MVVELPVGVLLDDDSLIAAAVAGGSLHCFFRLGVPDVSSPQAMLEHLPVHEHLVPPRLVRVDIEHIPIRDARQDDLLCTVLGIDGERVPDAIFQGRQLCLLRFEPVGGLPPCDILLDLEQIVLGLPLAGELLGDALRVNIYLIPDVIPDGIAALGLDQEEPLRGGIVAAVRHPRRLCQHLACAVGRVRQFRGGGHGLIGLVQQGLVETTAVLRHIEIQPHEARVLDGERRLFDGLAALHIGGLFVVVVTSVPIRRVPQEGVPDDRVIPLIDVCRGRGKTVSGSRERDGAELGVILLKGGIPLFVRAAQILAVLDERAEPLLDLGPAQAHLCVVAGVTDHQSLRAGLHTAPAAIGKLPALPTVGPILAFQILHTLIWRVLLRIKGSDTQFAAVIGGTVAEDALDLRVRNRKSGGGSLCRGLFLFFGHSKGGGLFALRLSVYH